MKIRNRHSNLEVVNTLRGELSEIDTRISKLSLDQSSPKLTFEHRHRLEIPKSLPPLSTNRPQKNLKHHSRVFKSIDPGCYKEIQFLESYFKLPQKAKYKRKINNSLSKPKFFKSKPKILPKATRLDPVTNPALITEDDLQKGIYSLVNLGIATKHSEVFESLNRENPPLVHNKVLFHNFSIQFEPLKPKKKEKKQLNFIFSEPLIPSKKSVAEITNPEQPKSLILTISKGSTVKDENFLEFSKAPKSLAMINIKHLEAASKKFNLPQMFINTQTLLSAQTTDFEDSLKIPENFEEVLKIVQGVRQQELEKIKRFKAALKIQCMWRRFKGAARMRRHKLEKGKVRIIETQFKKYKKKLYTKQFAASLREARSNKFSQRQDWLKSNWSSLKSTPIIELHMGSNLSSFPIPADIQISRIFLLCNPSASLYYITLQDLDIDIKKYFEFLMTLLEVNTDSRLRFIRPYTLCKSIMSDTAKALYLSLHDLVDLKYANKGKNMVYVPFETNEYDEFVADFLKIPIMGAVASVFQKYKKLARWRLMKNSPVQTIKAEGGLWTFEELLENSKKFGNSQIWVNDQKWNGQRWIDLAEVVIQDYEERGTVLCCLFMDPVGVITHNVSVEVNPGGNSFNYPQCVLNALFVLETVTVFSQFLYKEGIFGYFSVRVCSDGVVDFELGFDNNLSVNIFFKQLLKGEEINEKYFIAKQQVSELEQEIYVDENTNFVEFEEFKVKFLEGVDNEDREQRAYVWVPYLFHENLKGQKLTAIFHMCRLESVLFSLSKGVGVIFMPYGNLEDGCIGVIGVGEDLGSAMEFVAQGIFVLGISCGDEEKGNLKRVAKELGIWEKIEEIREDSENNEFLLKLL